MTNAVVIDVYRFCSLVHQLLENDCDVYCTNNRFLVGRYKAANPEHVVFAESKGIKMPAADFDNDPQDAHLAAGKVVMVRSSLGARRVEQAVDNYDNVYLACMYNYDQYAGPVDKIYYDDAMDEYCALLIKHGMPRNLQTEEFLKGGARNLATAQECFAPREGFKIAVRRVDKYVCRAYKVR